MGDVAVLLWRTTGSTNRQPPCWLLDILRVRGDITVDGGEGGNHSICIGHAVEGKSLRQKERVRILKEDYGPNLAATIGCPFLILDSRRNWYNWDRRAAAVDAAVYSPPDPDAVRRKWYGRRGQE